MTRRRVVVAAGVVLGAMLVGCGVRQPQAPVEEPLFQNACLSDELDVGSAGGTLSCGPYTLTIPSGALSSTVHITMEQESCGQWPVRLGPDGTQFAQAVTLEFDASGEPDPDAMTVAWWNPSAQRWEDQPTQHDGSTVSAEITHFSRWILY